MRNSAKLCSVLAVWMLGASHSAQSAITIQFDYSLDTNNFLAIGSDARTGLEAAATYFEGLFQDTFDAISPGTVYNNGLPSQFSDTWTVNFNRPDTNLPTSIVDLAIPANTVIIYAGGGDIDGVNGTLGIGGPWGFSVSGVPSFVDTVISRGEAGITNGSGTRLGTETDFAPGGGSIMFDSTEDWYYNSDVSNTANPGAGKVDFLSVALHELAHVFGIGSANSWDDAISGGAFTGANSKASNGGSNVTLDGGLGHWVNGTSNFRHLDGVAQETAMDPSIATAQRKLMTNLDLMGLKDIGWDINVSPVPEPSFYVALTGFGLMGFSLVRRRMRTAKA